jgi:porphyrinogen peroxidase
VGDVGIIPARSHGVGSTLVILQPWKHDSVAWDGSDTRRQEPAMGRAKDDSVELAADVM